MNEARRNKNQNTLVQLSLIATFAFQVIIASTATGQSSDLALDFTGTSLNSFTANLTLGWSFRVNEPVRVAELGFFDHFNADEDGTYILEAEINQDGVVNLLDVNPFVALLTGNCSSNGNWFT